MIRIIHVLGTLDRGGTEMMLMNLYRRLDRSKIQFDFIIHTQKRCDFEDEILSKGGRIYRLPRYSLKNHIKYSNFLEKFFQEHKEYRILHGHLRGSAFIYLKIAKKYNIFTIMHSHNIASRGNYLERFVKDLLRYPTRNYVDYPLACSNDAGKWFFGRNICQNKKFKIIKNAIEVEKFKFSISKREEMRNKLQIEDKIVLGHIGSFTYQKNHTFLLDIFFEFQKIHSESVLLLIGDGELRDEINKKIKKLEINDKVIMLGSIANVQDYLHVMDVFIFPSIYEGLPVVLIESQTNGLKSVVSKNVPKDVEMIPDLIEWEDIENTAKYWGQKINKMISYKRRNQEDIIRENGYDVSNSIHILIDIYNSIYKEKKYEEIIDYHR